MNSPVKIFILFISLFSQFVIADDLPSFRKKADQQIINPPLSQINKLCLHFKQVMDSPIEPNSNYLNSRTLEKVLDETYPNLDIDNDDINDYIQGGCPSSTNISDVCTIKILFSSGGKIEFDFAPGDRFYLARDRSQYFAIVNYAGSNQNIGRRKVYIINKTGFNQICNNL